MNEKSGSARENRTPRRPCDAHARSEVVLVDSEVNGMSPAMGVAAQHSTAQHSLQELHSTAAQHSTAQLSSAPLVQVLLGNYAVMDFGNV
tara:strand:- start:115 stop:384 length:270 start_codon:yes stop_codon:yes gene_type:complete